MPGIATADVRHRLRLVGELLGEGRAAEAEPLIEDVLAHRAELPPEEFVRSCGLSARLLALRGEHDRARMLADLAVALARNGTPPGCQAHAFLDQAHTLGTLGEHQRALACLRAAHELGR